MSTENSGTDAVRCGLHAFERNNYYYGKLLTVRDMRAEQAYHTGRLNSLDRFVVGTGVVCGLDVTASVEPIDVEGEEADGLVVRTGPGLALDACGRQVVLEREDVEQFPLAEVADETRLSVYLTHRSCPVEPVARDSLENACEEDCVENRILEDGEVSMAFESPRTTRYAPVPLVDFPSRSQVGERPRPLGDAPPGTLLVTHDPADEAAESASVLVVVLDRQQDALYNAAREEVTLASDDLLVDASGNRFVVTGAEAGTLSAREDAVPPEALVFSFDETPITVLASQEAEITGVTTLEPGTTFTVRVRSDDSDAPFLLTAEDVAVGDDGRFTAGFDFSQRTPGERFLATAVISSQGSSFRVHADGVVVADEVPEEPGDAETDEDRAFARIARSYYDDRPLTACGDAEVSDESVLLGWFVREGEGEWARARFERGPVVFSNHLLHAAVARHAAEFSNPHQVHLAVRRADRFTFGGEEETGSAAVLTVADLANAEDDVVLESPDETVSITPGLNGDSVAFEVAGLEDLRDRVEDLEGQPAPEPVDLEPIRARLSDLERYALRAGLACKRQAYDVLDEHSPGDSLSDSIDNVLGKVEEILANPDAFARDDEGNFSTYFEELRELRSLEQEVANGLEQFRSNQTAQSIDRFQNALGTLGGAIEREDPFEASQAQECVAEAAKWVVFRPNE